MKRRLLSLALALIMTLCLIPVTAFAAQDMGASNACISAIKFFEGFHQYPYWDYSQYTVGYGTRCPDGMLAHYRTYGITRTEAEALLRKELKTAEKAVNDLAEEHDLSLTQHQFDALVSFTYNVGQAWSYDETNLITQAVIEGHTGNDFIFALTRWCLAGGSVNSGLITRRLIEANIYLNGDYSTVVPANYGYVLFNHSSCLYNGKSDTVKIQGYDAALTDEVRPQGVRSGYRFLGWYTASSGGRWISHLDATTNGLTLYARWQSGEGNVSNGVIQGTAASYVRSTVDMVNVYKQPSAASEVAYTLAADTVVSILADYVDADGVKWGKLADGRWLNLGGTAPELTPAEVTEQEGILVTVTQDKMNVRSGPGTSYSIVRYAYEGEQMRITEIRDVSGTPWGKFVGGWICLNYTDYVDQGVTEEVIATGTVTLSSGSLNVRSGAGSGYSVVDSLKAGEKVSIYEIVTVSGTQWGRIAQGWICMNYVTLDEAEPPVEEPTTEATTEETTEATTEAPTTEATTEAPTTEPTTEATTEAPTTEPTTEATTEAPTEAPTEPEGDKPIATGTVNVSSGSLNVRSGPGSKYAVVTTLKKGAKVEILETKTVSGTQWGRIEKGWISMTYVKLNPTTSGGETTAQTGTVNTSSGSLNVRSGPGSNYSVVTSLKKGTAVTIYETKKVGSTTWGRMDKGWVSMAYIKLKTAENQTPATEPETEPETQAPAVTTGTRTGTVSISSGSLNVRSGAGTSYAKVGAIKGGEKVTITDFKIVGSTVWGKTAKGWISLDYVKLDQISAGSLAVVKGTSLNVRSGAGTSYSKVAAYTKGNVITILETKKVGSTNWGKTAKGWISLDYVI